MLRDFERRDQTAARDLILAGMRERWGLRFEPGANADTDDLWASYVDRGGEIVLLEVDGAVAAAGILVPDPDDQARGQLRRIAVADAHRRRGFASMIVSELLRRARRRGMREVRVSTDTPWTSAVALYRDLGFTEVGRSAEETRFSMSLAGWVDPGHPGAPAAKPSSTRRWGSSSQRRQ